MIIKPNDVLQAVRRIRQALTNRGFRPSNIVLVLAVPGNPVVGATESMSLQETHDLLEIGLRSPPEIPKPDILRNEIIEVLKNLALPETFAIVFQDRHNGTYGQLVHGCVLAPTIGGAMFVVGRLIGQLDSHNARHRAEQQAQSIKVTAKPVRWHHRLLSSLKRSKN